MNPQGLLFQNTSNFMGKRTPETEFLLQALKEFYEEKRLAEYRLLDKIVPFIQEKRYYLVSALRILKIEYGYLFKCVPGVGYLPISNDDKVSEIEKNRLSKIKSQVAKYENELDAVNFEMLNKFEQQRYMASQIKLTCHKTILDEKLDQTYSLIGAKCVNAGKIDFNMGDLQDAFKALKV